MKTDTLIVLALFSIVGLLWHIAGRLGEIVNRLQPTRRPPRDGDDPIKLIRGDTYNISQHVTAIRQKLDPIKSGDGPVYMEKLE